MNRQQDDGNNNDDDDDDDDTGKPEAVIDQNEEEDNTGGDDDGYDDDDGDDDDTRFGRCKNVGEHGDHRGGCSYSNEKADDNEVAAVVGVGRSSNIASGVRSRKRKKRD